MLGLYPLASAALGDGESLDAVGASLATTEAQDTASFSISLVAEVFLAATEAQDTASLNVSVVSNLNSIVLAATEARDVANFVVTSATSLQLSATEARDTASFSLENFYLLQADKGGYSYTGYDALLAHSHTLEAAFGDYIITGNDASFVYRKTITAERGGYSVTGYAARLYDSSFFYIDSEVIYVPQEINFVLVPPAGPDADENIVVPAEIQRLTLDFEDRQIAAPARRR